MEVDTAVAQAGAAVPISALQAPAEGGASTGDFPALQAPAAGERLLRRRAPRPPRRRTWPTTTLPKRPQARASLLTLRRPLWQLEHRPEPRLRPPPRACALLRLHLGVRMASMR